MPKFIMLLLCGLPLMVHAQKPIYLDDRGEKTKAKDAYQFKFIIRKGYLEKHYYYLKSDSSQLKEEWFDERGSLQNIPVRTATFYPNGDEHTRLEFDKRFQLYKWMAFHPSGKLKAKFDYVFYVIKDEKHDPKNYGLFTDEDQYEVVFKPMQPRMWYFEDGSVRAVEAFSAEGEWDSVKVFWEDGTLRLSANKKNLKEFDQEGNLIPKARIKERWFNEDDYQGNYQYFRNQASYSELAILTGTEGFVSVRCLLNKEGVVDFFFLYDAGPPIFHLGICEKLGLLRGSSSASYDLRTTWVNVDFMYGLRD